MGISVLEAARRSVRDLTMARHVSQALRITAAFTAFALGFLMIAFAADAPTPTFDKDVAPILFKHCVTCHRPGEIASGVSLLSYDAALPWTKSIKEKVLRREMPPWPADPSRSVKFRNDPRLTQREIDTLVSWVKAGAPRGSDTDLPPTPSFPQGWLHPKGIAPDLVMTLPESQLPAGGEIPYLRYLVKVPLSEDKWIIAMQVLPGNRAVVHHMAITELELADGVTPENIDKLDQVAKKLGFSNGLNTHFAVAAPGNPALHDMLGVYTPGTTFEMYEDGSAKLLKGGKNLYLNFNIHYQTTGKIEKDRTRVAFWFQPEPPKHQLLRIPASGDSLIADGRQLLTDDPGEKAEGTTVAIPPIPPYAENYEVIGITAYTQPVTIYQLQPHAHLRGKDFSYAVVYPDGRERTLLSVPKYDFHWQLAYELDTPLKLPAGSKLVVTAHYDNSLKNDHLLDHQGRDRRTHDLGHNAGPEKEVHFREMNQSWDEMFTPFIQYAIDSEDLGKQMTSSSSHAGRIEGSDTLPQGVSGERNILIIGQAVGCLEEDPSGTWILTKASDPIESKVQAASLADVGAAAAKPLGNRRYRLLGVDIFNPSSQKGHEVSVKGALIKDARENRLNVTSLQTIGATCL
jgi:mono/diheme cytochrome c family protein